MPWLKINEWYTLSSNKFLYWKIALTIAVFKNLAIKLFQIQMKLWHLKILKYLWTSQRF